MFKKGDKIQYKVGRGTGEGVVERLEDERVYFRTTNDSLLHRRAEGLTKVTRKPRKVVEVAKATGDEVAAPAI